jgi:hypothetical protein
MQISKYWKGIIAALAPVITTIGAAVDDGKIDGAEALTIAGVLTVLVGVVAKSNAQQPPAGDA